MDQKLFIFCYNYNKMETHVSNCRNKKMAGGITCFIVCYKIWKNIVTRDFARIYVYVADMSIIDIATYNVIYNCFDIVAIYMKLDLIELILRLEIGHG